VEHNNFGGGFVSDGDRVALSSMRFASGMSAGGGRHQGVGRAREATHGRMPPGAVPTVPTVHPPRRPCAGAAEKVVTEAQVAHGTGINWMEASLEQLSTPLPPWAIRAGACQRAAAWRGGQRRQGLGLFRSRAELRP
jgi:hypothetical protein